MSMPNEETSNDIEQRIEQLMRRIDQPLPRTRQLLQHLSEIEKGLDQGVSRAQLAEVFDMSLSQFSAALAGARRLQRQGGDGRRKRHRTASKRPPIHASQSTLTDL